MRRSICFLSLLAMSIPLATVGRTQEQSVNPGINDSFQNPDVDEFEERFEVESREVFSRRNEIVEASQIEPGHTVADIGAGTGLFTRLFSEAVGKKGRVIAVDISQNFLDHIAATSREHNQQNVQTVLATADSTELPENSVDVAFICDTYHHFEFPQKTMASLHRALKPGGRVVLIDFHRIPGTSSEWTLNHVRAGQEVFEAEIEQSGFRKTREEPDLLEENYFVVFEKQTEASSIADGRVGQNAGRGPGRGFGRGAGRGHRPGFGRGPGRGPGAGQARGQGRGQGRGPGVPMRADQEIFHFLLENHDKIRRDVQRLDDGVETLTESDDPEVAKKIQEHVASMKQRIEEGRGLRFWDDLFVAIFEKYPEIEMTVEKTEKGVRVRETSKDPAAVILIQAHADVVSKFVELGFEEAHRNHPVPKPKPEGNPPTNDSASLVFPIIEGHGGVVARPSAAEQPQAGGKVVIDATADAPPADINPGLLRVARLLNLYGAAGLKASDAQVAVVLHGEATKSVLGDAAYKTHFAVEKNPNLPLIAQLQKAGVEVFVCGQALDYKGFQDAEVAEGIPIAASALSVVINKQNDGFGYLPVAK